MTKDEILDELEYFEYNYPDREERKDVIADFVIQVAEEYQPPSRPRKGTHVRRPERYRSNKEIVNPLFDRILKVVQDNDGLALDDSRDAVTMAEAFDDLIQVLLQENRLYVTAELQKKLDELK
jgi:hypothetical protein